LDTVPGLKELQTQKRALLVESDLNRHLLRVEVSRITCRWEQFRRGYGRLHQAWTWTIPLLGFFLARKLKTRSNLFAKGSFWFSALRSAWQVWERFRGRDYRPPPH